MTWFPLAALFDVAGIPLPDLLPKDRIDAIVERHPQRRCGNRQSPQDWLRLLRPVRRCRRNG